MNGMLKTITVHINACKILGYNSRTKTYSVELTDVDGKKHPLTMTDEQMSAALKTEAVTGQTKIVA